MTAREPLVLQAAEHSALAQALLVLDAVLAQAVEQQAGREGEGSLSDPWRGLHLSDEQAQALLFPPGHEAHTPNAADLLAAAVSGVPRWARASRALGLGPLDLAIALMVAAPDLDLRYGRLYGYLQDDLTRRRPGPDLLTRLLAEAAPQRASVSSRLRSAAPLMAWGLIADNAAPPHAAAEEQGPWLARGLRLDPMWLNWLQGVDELDAQTAQFARPLTASELPLGAQPLGPLQAEAHTLQELTALLERVSQGQGVLRLWLHGPAGAGKRALAHATAQAMGAGLLLVDLGAGEDRPTVMARAQRGARAALLLGQWPCYLFEPMGSPQKATNWTHLSDALASLDGPWLAMSEHPCPPAGGAPVSALRLGLTVPSPRRRQALWSQCLQQRGLSASPATLRTVGSRFVLNAAQVAQAAADLQLQRQLQCHLQPNEPHAGQPAPTNENSTVGLHDLTSVARAQSTVALGPLAQRVTPSARFDTLVCAPEVADQLREICTRLDTREQVRDWCGGGAQVRASGISALFVGASGTGKTLAAEAVACELGLDLLRIDLSGVVSKYIGETEKNLDQVFTVAGHANAVLFFDEADALFGKRSEVKDARDRYANIEVAYLLQKMEQFEGLAILATNLKQNLDDAFARRLTFSVNFPYPEAPERLRLWQTVWPRHAPCADDVDLPALAHAFRLTGGNIRNAVVAAAHLAAAEGAPIAQAHLLHATRREFQKMGRQMARTDAAGSNTALGLGVPA